MGASLRHPRLNQILTFIVIVADLHAVDSASFFRCRCLLLLSLPLFLLLPLFIYTRLSSSAKLDPDGCDHGHDHDGLSPVTPDTRLCAEI